VDSPDHVNIAELKQFFAEAALLATPHEHLNHIPGLGLTLLMTRMQRQRAGYRITETPTATDTALQTAKQTAAPSYHGANGKHSALQVSGTTPTNGKHEATNRLKNAPSTNRVIRAKSKYALVPKSMRPKGVIVPRF
jgi:hypothetical protein